MTIHFEPNEWAPGVWAGLEGWTVEFMGSRYIVTFVSMEHRYVRLRSAATPDNEYY